MKTCEGYSKVGPILADVSLYLFSSTRFEGPFRHPHALAFSDWHTNLLSFPSLLFASTEISPTILFFFTSGLHSSSSSSRLDSATAPASSFSDRPRELWGKKWRLWLSFRARRAPIWMKGRREQMGFFFLASFSFWIDRNWFVGLCVYKYIYIFHYLCISFIPFLRLRRMWVFLVHCNLRQFHRIVLCLYVLWPPMLSQKRNPDDGDGSADGDNPDDKRRKFCFMRYYYHMVLFSLFYFFLWVFVSLIFCGIFLY